MDTVETYGFGLPKISKPQKIYGNKLIVKRIFELFVRFGKKEPKGVILCTDKGVILKHYGITSQKNITGQALDLEWMKNREDYLYMVFFYNYIVFYPITYGKNNIEEIVQELIHTKEKLSLTEEMLDEEIEKSEDYEEILNEIFDNE